jgi:hypothetical protein
MGELSKSASASKKSEKVSERDEFWLDHHAAHAASGQTAKEYAAAQGLTPNAFYQARKRPRTLGLLASARASRRSDAEALIPAGATTVHRDTIRSPASLRSAS